MPTAGEQKQSMTQHRFHGHVTLASGATRRYELTAPSRTAAIRMAIAMHPGARCGSARSSEPGPAAAVTTAAPVADPVPDADPTSMDGCSDLSPETGQNPCASPRGMTFQV